MWFLFVQISHMVMPLSKDHKPTTLWKCFDSFYTKMSCFHCIGGSCWSIPIKLVWFDSSTSPHNGQPWQIVLSTLALHTLFSTTLFQIAQMNYTSFVLLSLCHVFVHLNLKFSGSKLGNLFSTILIFGSESLTKFHPKVTK